MAKLNNMNWTLRSWINVDKFRYPQDDKFSSWQNVFCRIFWPDPIRRDLTLGSNPTSGQLWCRHVFCEWFFREIPYIVVIEPWILLKWLSCRLIPINCLAKI